ncbi:MAG: cell division protein FtsZ [Nanoarchaeota archaeon]|nr:cell division protein FtsZ [Nanoarchaeota archaeon]MBU1643614.1 cell division protein FtsZ [Nanoarchaeota archaeon]MBU1976328.1 cell division protein FtsZ [Nanoarchaeota archaeon]
MDGYVKEVSQQNNTNQEHQKNKQYSPSYAQTRVYAEQISHKKANADLDEELERLIASQKTRIRVIGCGGGGNNTINRISEVGIKGIETIAINTDAQDLLYTTADKKILIGKELTQGLGAGSNPKIGEEAARESEHELKKSLEGADMIFITCGLGGGTGTGSAPIIAQLAKKMGMLSVGIVTIPFTMEGSHRFENAMIGLEKLEQSINTLIVIPNEKLLELAPHLPLQTAFKVADEILTNAVKGIAELVTKTGLVNLDFADVKTIMNEGGVALIGMGESESDSRADESVQKALDNPLIDVDISNATGALINISGGESLTLDEARKIVETVSERLDPKAKIIWGAQIYKDLDRTIRTMLIITGVNSEQIFGAENTYFGKKKTDIENELGIEFMK